MKNGITSGPGAPNPIVLVVNMVAISRSVSDINRYAVSDYAKSMDLLILARYSMVVMGETARWIDATSLPFKLHSEQRRR